MRPEYESEADRAQEAFVAQFMEREWRCKMFKLPKSYGLDFAATRDGQVLSLVEYKRRKKEYPTVMLSMLKISMIKNWHEVLGISCFFAAGYDDKLIYAKWPFEIGNVEINGNKKRGDKEGDIELVAMIPKNQFTMIEWEAPPT